jgi:flavin reductase (DIM6/NTAB) family NADH-FMN oxidoreductase RutF
MLPGAGEFRRVCGRWATGVAVITAVGQDNAPRGLTANSFTSVSLDPPLVAFCVARTANVFRQFEAARVFGINILAEEQRDLSVRFATVDGEERFEGVEWRLGETGAPLLAGALAWMEGTLAKKVDAGDHVLYVVKVRKVGAREGQPLVYFGGAYRALS